MAVAFHRYGYFKIWPWGHTGGPASIWCTSFPCHVNRPNHSKGMTNRMFTKNKTKYCKNKANLRDLIAATSLVILLKFYPNRFFNLYGLEIWQLTWKTTGNLFHASRSYVCVFIAIREFKLEPNHQFFSPCDLEIGHETSRKGTVFYHQTPTWFPPMVPPF